MPDQDEKCFACAKVFKGGKKHLVNVAREDQDVYVGPECYRRIKRAGNQGYQPPKGGPKLYHIKEDVPANSIGSGAIAMFDPVLKARKKQRVVDILKRKLTGV